MDLFLLLLGHIVVVSCQPPVSHYNQAAFMAKRRMQWEEITHILNRIKSTRLHEAVKQITSTLLDTLRTSHETIRNVELTEPITDEEQGNAYALLLENTALMADLVLRFPEVAAEFFDESQSQRLDLARKVFEIARQSNILPANDLSLLSLAEQEINLVERPENYSNPFTSKNQMMEERKIAQSKQEKEKKLRRVTKKGPRISAPRTEL